MPASEDAFVLKKDSRRSTELHRSVIDHLSGDLPAAVNGLDKFSSRRLLTQHMASISVSTGTSWRIYNGRQVFS